MGLGNLSIKVNADIGNFTTNLDLASRISQDRMRESAASVDIFRRGMSQAAIDTKTAAEQMSSSMLAANDAIGNSATSAAGSLSSIEKSAGNTKFAAEQMGSSMVAANDLIVSSA
ncbi:MAG: hypothetical protein WA071_17325, partial [Undibacterium umbellatum]|uniref:hypothetical protein n=1 Tax=Undibacterium umbellatum TaxID=2762300 RepID=UPI003BB505B8